MYNPIPAITLDFMREILKYLDMTHVS
jgi:hypothetical protein